MEIKTKFNLGEDVFYIDSTERIEHDNILGISIGINDIYNEERFPDHVVIKYDVAYNKAYYEYELFRTKEEVIEYFLEKSRCEYTTNVNRFLNKNENNN